MKTSKQIKLPTQSKPKSVLDMTPYELAKIEKFQNHNKGFRDWDYEYLENGIGHDSDYFWED